MPPPPPPHTHTHPNPRDPATTALLLSMSSLISMRVFYLGGTACQSEPQLKLTLVDNMLGLAARLATLYLLHPGDPALPACFIGHTNLLHWTHQPASCICSYWWNCTKTYSLRDCKQLTGRHIENWKKKKIGRGGGGGGERDRNIPILSPVCLGFYFFKI